jgi:hypothetical protein
VDEDVRDLELRSRLRQPHRDRLEELRASARVLLSPMQPGVLDRDGHAAREVLRDAQVHGLEPAARLGRHEDERADRAVAEAERGDHHGREPARA